MNIRRWLVPSLAAHRFNAPPEFPVDGRVTRRASCLFRLEIQHESLEDTILFAQASASTGGPLASGRYRR